MIHQDGNNNDGVMDVDDIETSDEENDNFDDDSDKYETDLDEEIRKSKYGISGKAIMLLLFFLHAIIDPYT